VLGEGDRTDIDLAETKPGQDDGRRDDAQEPEAGIIHASVAECLSWLTGIVAVKDDLGPDQSHNGPSKEAVGPLEAIVKLVACGGIGEHEHHQEQSQDYP